MTDRADLAMVAYARARFPAQFGAMKDVDILPIVADVRARARAHAVTGESDVATAFDLSVMYGPTFYEAPWARDVFDVREWSGSEKLAVLSARVRHRLADF